MNELIEFDNFTKVLIMQYVKNIAQELDNLKQENSTLLEALKIAENKNTEKDTALEVLKKELETTEEFYTDAKEQITYLKNKLGD